MHTEGAILKLMLLIITGAASKHFPCMCLCMYCYTGQAAIKYHGHAIITKYCAGEAAITYECDVSISGHDHAALLSFTSHLQRILSYPAVARLHGETAAPSSPCTFVCEGVVIACTCNCETKHTHTCTYVCFCVDAFCGTPNITPSILRAHTRKLD